MCGAPRVPRGGDLAHPQVHAVGLAELVPAVNHRVRAPWSAVKEGTGGVHDLGRELWVEAVADVVVISVHVEDWKTRCVAD